MLKSGYLLNICSRLINILYNYTIDLSNTLMMISLASFKINGILFVFYLSNLPDTGSKVLLFLKF